MLTPHVEVLDIWSIIDHVDSVAKNLTKRFLRDLLIAVLLFPFMFALGLVLMFDLWLLVTGTYQSYL